MDFHQLLAKMQQLDAPAQTAAPVEECGEMPPSPMNSSVTPPTNPPSMSVNLNAQGMDNIEDLLKLITKVNPDMDKTADAGLPALGAMPSITPPGPKIGGLGNLDAGPLKMLPDFDADNDDKVGGEKPAEIEFDLDSPEGPENKEGPTDLDDKGPEEDDEEKEDEGFGNGLAGHDDVEYKGMDASIPSGNDLNKSKDTFPKVAGADNPMQKNKFESGDLRAQIRAELLQRLAEAKGAK